MIAISLADFSASGVPDYLMTTPDYAAERATIKELAAKVRKQIESDGQASPETLANFRAAITALKAKVDSLLPQDAPNRLEADNYLKALIGLSKMLKTPSVARVPHGAEQGANDDTGTPDLVHAHLQPAFRRGQDPGTGDRSTISSTRSWSRFATRPRRPAPTPTPPRAAHRTPRRLGNYFSGMQYDPKHGVVPPPPPPSQP